MNVEAIQAMGHALKREGSRLSDIRGAIDHATSALETLWRGREAVAFSHDWHGLRTQLESVSSDLVGLGQSALNNASEQERVSSDFAEIAAEVRIPEHQQMLRLAANAYETSSVDMPPGWAEVTDAELRALGLDPASFHKASGLDATLFQDEHGRYALAFRGSETRGIGGIADWAQNLVALDGVSEQQKQAVALALQVQQASGGHVTFVGHSLGGSLAALSAAATGQSAVTLNASGVSTAALVMATRQGGDPSLLDHVGIAGDFVINRIDIAGNLLQGQRDAMMDATFGDRITAYNTELDPLTFIQDVVGPIGLGPGRVPLSNPPSSIGEQRALTNPTQTPFSAHSSGSMLDASGYKE